MADLSTERFAVGTARRAFEAALRNLRSAEVHADFWREPDGSIAVVDQQLNPEIFAEIATLQPALDAATASLDVARAELDRARRAYDDAARQDPLFDGDNTHPVLLLPVRMEAIYFDNGGAAELRIRVYPDDVHVDSHEPELTERERDAGMAYWRAERAAATPAERQAAWQALVGATGGARATWVRRALTPTDAGAGAGEPVFPEVELRPDAWNRAAHSRVLPHHFEFSAYRDGALAWRQDGAPIIPDPLPVGIAPRRDGDDGGAEPGPDDLGFDLESRWLVRFDDAVMQGMAIVVGLANFEERFDRLTVVGVGTQDVATGAARVQEMLAAHANSGGLTPLPVGTPTNNTPASRSGWRSRGAPPEPDVVEQWQAVYDAGSDQEAARLARALGIDGATVLATVCDPAGGDESLLRRLHRLQAQFYSWSRALRPVANTDPNQVPSTEPWFATVADHYVRFVRSRGPLPPLRIGRQPYGILPISPTDLWRGDDLDADIVRFVGSFQASFAEHVPQALQVGETPDQDAALLDLLSREASPRRVVNDLFFTTDPKVDTGRAPASAVGAIPARAMLAWLHANDGPGPDEPGGDPATRIEPFPDQVPDVLRDLVAEHPLTQLLVLFDESLQTMRDTQVPPDPAAFAELYGPLARRLAQLKSPPTLSLFYDQAEWSFNALNNILSSGPDLPDQVMARVAQGTLFRDLFAAYVAFENDAAADLPRLERLFRETLEPLSHRIDAWVTSLATARLALLRQQQPAGLRVGAYGWLDEVERGDPNPPREGYVVTPSLHHATTAAVLRSGWQAHSDRRAFAIDVQSTRVRRAQSMVEGVRGGQTVPALLGYQFERALHDARLDRFVAGFRSAYPLAPLVQPDGPGAAEAQVAIGARNVVDGQALRRDRVRLDGDDAALAAAAGAGLDGDAVTLRRMIAELDETFDAVGDLLLAESVHQLVGGSALRAGLAADAVGRGQDLPADYDMLRTPRSGIGVTHHVGLLLPGTARGGGGGGTGWADDRPLVELEPGLEGWARERLGPATGWAVGPALADLGWCALDLLIAPVEVVRSALAALGGGGVAVDPEVFADLTVVCDRLRSALASATPLTPLHLDPTDRAPATGYDLGQLHDRLGPWLAAVAAAAAGLAAADTPDAAPPILARLGALGVPVGRGDVGDVDRVRALLAGVDTTAPDAPPDPVAHPVEADAWLAVQLSRAGQLLHPAIRLVPRLVRPLPPAPAAAAGADDDAVAAWLRDMALVRPRVDALDGALVAAETLAGTAGPVRVVAQTVAPDEGPRPWMAVAPPADGPRPKTSLVLHRDGGDAAGAAGPVAGLVVDSWTEVVPRAPGANGPEEIVGVAFDFDRPGARAPQAMLLAVPPDPSRGWCREDLHACLDEAHLLARIRTLDLDDMPEMRNVLPIPNGQG